MEVGKHHQINNEIEDSFIRLIDKNGVTLGVVSLQEALQTAFQENLDLVKIPGNVAPPVCKIMDYSRYRFEKNKKKKEDRKKQRVITTKEIRLTLNIGENDLLIKAKHARKFLEDGSRVFVTIRLKGREVSHSELGKVILMKFFDFSKDIAQMSSGIAFDGRQISINLVKRNKSSIDVQ